MTVYIKELVDERDGGLIVLTHTYLLVGCGMTLALDALTSTKSQLCAIPSLSGLLVLGIGDSAASIGGVRFGRHRWPASSRSFEGTFAMIAALSAITLAISYAMNELDSLQRVVNVLIACISVSLIEATTEQIDNLLLPLFFFLVTKLAYA